MTTPFDEFDDLVAKDQWDLALILALALSEKLPDLPKTWFNLGVCLKQTNQHLKASEAFQRCLLLDPTDEKAVFQMLHSLLLADRRNALYEELRTYAYEDRAMLTRFAEHRPFSDLFAEANFASLLKEPKPQGPKQRQQNIATVKALGFSVPDELPEHRTASGYYLRFMPEIALRAQSLRCLYEFVRDEIPSEAIGDYVEHISAFNYLAPDEQTLLSMPRDQAQVDYGHIAGWFAERILPLAWILGFPILAPPDGQPILDDTIEPLSKFMGDFEPFENIWIWMDRFPSQRSSAEATEIEDQYYLSHVAVQYARGGHIQHVPNDFDPVFHGGIVLERWASLMWALTPNLPLNAQLF